MNIQRIVADTEGTVQPGETIIYKVDVDDIIKILRENKENVITIWQLEEFGLDALDLDAGLWGSAVIGDTLYLMKTDGQDILIDSENVNPEEAIEYVQKQGLDLSTLDPYIQDTDEKYVRIAVSPDVMQTPDFDDVAYDLLKTGTPFIDIVEAAEEYDGFRE